MSRKGLSYQLNKGPSLVRDGWEEAVGNGRDQTQPFKMPLEKFKRDPLCVIIQEGFQVRKVAQKLDFINVMTYDMHGSWDGYAHHHSKLADSVIDIF